MAAKTSTARWREWRERQARGEIVLDYPVDYQFVALMLAAGKISERDSRNRRRLAEAIHRLALEGISNALEASRD